MKRECKDREELMTSKEEIPLGTCYDTLGECHSPVIQIRHKCNVLFPDAQVLYLHTELGMVHNSFSLTWRWDMSGSWPTWEAFLNPQLLFGYSVMFTECKTGPRPCTWLILRWCFHFYEALLRSDIFFNKLIFWAGVLNVTFCPIPDKHSFWTLYRRAFKALTKRYFQLSDNESEKEREWEVFLVIYEFSTRHCLLSYILF